MVNDAELTVLGPAADCSVDNWRQAVEVDLVGTFIGCQVAGKQIFEHALLQVVRSRPDRRCGRAKRRVLFH